MCKFEAETGIHALWNCGVVRDVWAGCSVRLQKCAGEQGDMLQLMEFLIARLSPDDLELFLVQAWIIWNQRNGIIHGKQLQPPEVLIKRALSFSGGVSINQRSTIRLTHYAESVKMETTPYRSIQVEF